MTMKKTFTTHELKTWQKWAQLYFLINKRYKLAEFVIDGDRIMVKTQRGDELQAPLHELNARFSVDKNNRKMYTLRYGEKKIDFLAIPWMLTDEEWEEIDMILSRAQVSGEKSSSKALRFLDKLLDWFK